jgi:hypothetical protein
LLVRDATVFWDEGDPAGAVEDWTVFRKRIRQS